ncbi:MAG: DUF3822 family protein [Phocaeicola sp.]
MTSSIDLKQSEQYILSIRLSADGFSFCIYSSENHETLFRFYTVNEAYSMTANIKEWISQTEELKLKYKKVNILVDSNRFTTIPFDLFDDENSESLFYYNQLPINNEIVLCNILGETNLALLFGMDKYAHQFLHEQFPQARFYASISTVSELLCKHKNPQASGILYAYLRKNKLEIYAFAFNKLLLINSYACQQTSDRIYFILSVWKQLNFCQEKNELCLIGNKRIKEEVMQEVEQYIRNISLPKYETLLNQNEELPKEISLDLAALLCYEKEENNKK